VSTDRTFATYLQWQLLRALPRRLYSPLRRLTSRGEWSPPQNANDGLSDAPDREELARRCRSVLRESLVEFYDPHSLDRRHGGYLELLNDERFFSRGRKHSVFIARQVWFFSVVSSWFPACAEAATWGYEFLSRHLLDPESGGVYIMVDDDGAPLNRRKHAYVQSIVLYALAAYHRATGSAAALEQAVELFRTFERRAYDERHGGYEEWFQRDWTPIRDPDAVRFLGGPAQKTVSTHLHILEAYADLYRIWPDPLLCSRLEELNDLVAARLDLGPDFVGEAFRLDWTACESALPPDVSYGHCLEAVWMVLDAERAVGRDARRRLEWAVRVTDECLRRGYDHRLGGLFNRGALGRRAHDLRKLGWAQAESMICLLDLHRLTGRADYFQRFVEVLRFTLRHIVAREGGWYSHVLPDGGRRPGCPRTGPWQAAYHAGRALFRCGEMLEAEAPGLRDDTGERESA
jgi:mannobiose 2-epimerase